MVQCGNTAHCEPPHFHMVWAYRTMSCKGNKSFVYESSNVPPSFSYEASHACSSYSDLIPRYPHLESTIRLFPSMKGQFALSCGNLLGCAAGTTHSVGDFAHRTVFVPLCPFQSVPTSNLYPHAQDCSFFLTTYCCFPGISHDWEFHATYVL